MSDESTMPYRTEAEFVEPGSEGAPPHATPEMAALIEKVGSFMLANDHRGLILARRMIRKRMFRIRNALMRGEQPAHEDDAGLRAWMDLQLGPHKQWYMLGKDARGNPASIGGFSFDWDVSFKEPLKVIEPIEWDGHVDQELYQKTGIRQCVPPAFTKQG